VGGFFPISKGGEFREGGGGTVWYVCLGGGREKKETKRDKNKTLSMKGGKQQQKGERRFLQAGKKKNGNERKKVSLDALRGRRRGTRKVNDERGGLWWKKAYRGTNAIPLLKRELFRESCGGRAIGKKGKKGF